MHKQQMHLIHLICNPTTTGNCISATYEWTRLECPAPICQNSSSKRAQTLFGGGGQNMAVITWGRGVVEGRRSGAQSTVPGCCCCWS